MLQYLLENPILQIAILFGGIVLIALLASFVTGNFRKSLSFLIDAGTFAGATEELDRRGFNAGLLLTIMGMLIFGGLISVLNNAFVQQLEESRLTRIHSRIDGAFDFPSYSGNARRFLDQHDIRTHARGYTIEDLEYELEISRADIVDSIALLQGFRVRQVFSPKTYIAVEKLNSNREFGTLVDRRSAATLLSTGSTDCRFLGHFSYVLSDNLDANYVSNDFFMGGHLDVARRRSFTNHAANRTFESPDHGPHQEFFDALNDMDEHTTLYVYSGCNQSLDPAISSILVSCAASRAPQTPSETCAGIPNFQQHFSRFQKTAAALGFSVGLDSDAMREEHISINTHRRFGKPVINLYPSIGYMGMEEELSYYQLMKATLDFIKVVEEETGSI